MQICIYIYVHELQNYSYTLSYTSRTYKFLYIMHNEEKKKLWRCKLLSKEDYADKLCVK